MLCADVRSSNWLEQLPSGNAIIVMEGVSMYLQPSELRDALSRICDHFEGVSILMDCYTEFAAKASRVRNPINDVGVTQVCGLDKPQDLERNGLSFVREHEMTPADLVDELHGMEKKVFKALYAGSIANKMYRLYEYRGENHP